MQTVALLIALGVASFTVAEWTFPSQLSLDYGMFGGDTTWYHMPFAARIAQEASTVHLHYTDPLRLAAWFYPQSSELIHAAGIVVFKTDWLSPLINLIWLAIALLAAWCVGRPYKVGPATLVAGAIVLDAGVMIETQPGEGRNDIMGLAFLIAFAAFLINGHQRRAPKEGAVQDTPERDAPLLDKGPLVLAGIAAGLAASVKLTFLVPVVAIWLGVVVFSGKGRRLTTAWVLGLSTFVVGGYWYVRAAIKTGGNPIPSTGFGPLHLPRPDQMPLDPRPRFAVSHYLTDPTIYRRWFFPRLDDAFGPLWPLILIVAVAAAVFIAVRSRNRILQVIAAAALLTAVVYLFTPLTAAGQEGSPTGFFTNTRYLVPGPGAGDDPAADRPAAARSRLARPADAALPGRGLRDHGADHAALVSRLHRRHGLPHPGAGLGAVGAEPVARAAGGQPRLRRRGRRRACCCSPSCSAAPRRSSTTTSTTRARPRSCRTAVRARPTPSPATGTGRGSGSPARARSSSASTASTAPTSTTTSSTSAPQGPDGTYRLATSCHQFRRLINEGDYDFLIISKCTQDSPEAEYWYPIYAWLKSDPALELVIEEPEITPEPDYVFKVKGKLDTSCADVGRRLTPGPRPAPRACSRTSAAERSGCSHQNMWPTSSSSCGSTESSAAIWIPLSTPSSRSAVPWMTWVGTSSPARAGRWCRGRRRPASAAGSPLCGAGSAVAISQNSAKRPRPRGRRGRG